MFFSTELLSRRDSGIGLLWLAATLGAKSSLKKLPKRSVLTADIAQLCSMIREPSEPLALRLSSNLMIGVVRVYMVKQELLMTDVQTCFTTLKRAVQVAQMPANSDLAQLQMSQPTNRPDVVTLPHDPGASFAIEFDDLIADWDNILVRDEGEDDEQYAAGTRRTRRKDKRQSDSMAEQGRGQHMLSDPNDFLLSPSLDTSLPEIGGSFGPMSSQLEGGRFDDIMGVGDDLGLGLEGLEDLGRELGWEMPEHVSEPGPGLDIPPLDNILEDNISLAFDDFAPYSPVTAEPDFVSSRSPSKRLLLHRDEDNGSSVVPGSTQGEDVGPDDAQPEADCMASKPLRPRKKVKKEVLVMDQSTELAETEHQTARKRYGEEQDKIKWHHARKRAESQKANMVDKLLWGVPDALVSPDLFEFWTQTVILRRQHAQAPPSQRRKSAMEGIQPAGTPPHFYDQTMDVPMGDDFTMEPEQGRFGSRPLSDVRSMRVGASPQYGRDSGAWADPSSSVGLDFPVGEGSSRGSLPLADVRIGRHSRSSSRRESSIIPGAFGVGDEPSVDTDIGLAPTQAFANDFAFALTGPAADVSQQSDTNLAVLESDSLEFAKTQLHNLQSGGSVTFNEITPPNFSTKHVAASVFYQCLVLVTKDLIKVQQDTPFTPIIITKK